MNISPWELYFLLKLDAIRTSMGWFSFLFFVVAVVTFIVIWIWRCSNDYKMGNGDHKKSLRKWIRRATVAVLLGVGLSFAQTIIPSTKEMLTISVVPKVVNSEFVQKDLPAEAKEVYTELKKWLIAQAKEEVVEAKNEVKDQVHWNDDAPVRHLKKGELRQLMHQVVKKEFQDAEQRQKLETKYKQ